MLKLNLCSETYSTCIGAHIERALVAKPLPPKCP